jgi:hypothetical protein
MALASAPPRAGLAGSLALLALAVAALAAGGYQLLRPAPTPAPETRLIQEWHDAEAGETRVRLLAQVDFTTQLTLTANGEAAFVLPLIAVPPRDAALAAPEAPAVLGALVYPGLGTLDDARLDALLDTTLGMGPRGPIVRLTATPLPGGAFRAALAERMAPAGRTVLADAPMLLWQPPVAAPQLQWLQIAGAVAAGLAFFGITLKMRREARPSRRQTAGAHHRIPAYVPAMATGEDGHAALRRVIAPAPAEVRVRPVAEVEPPRFAAARRSPARDRAAATRRPAASRPANPGAALFAAVRFGQGCAEELHLSRRAAARLAADPFCQRLARLN